MALAAVLGAVAAWFIWRQAASGQFDWRLAISSFRRLQWGWLALSTLFIVLSYVDRALRWSVFLKPLKPRPSLRNLLSATVIGFTALTLFGRAGEFVRPYLIAVKEQVPLPSQLAAWVLERLFDLLMAMLLFGFALSRISRTHVQVGSRLAWVIETGGWIVTFVCLGIILLLVSMRHFADPIHRWLIRIFGFLPQKHFVMVERWLIALVQGVESTRSDAALLLILVYSFVEWLLIAACYWCLAQSFANMMHLSFVDVLIFMGFVSFGSIVQLPGVGGGVQVVAVLVLTELFGIHVELATSFAVVIWIITFVVVVPVGLLTALHEGLNWRSLRELSREVR